MPVRRCLRAGSPGITRPFERLCPALGLVAVALLTLAPRPLRSVRLACLIHAANVHSEPGSNPSKETLVSGTNPFTTVSSNSSRKNLLGRPIGRQVCTCGPTKLEPLATFVTATVRRLPSKAQYLLGLLLLIRSDQPDCQRATRHSRPACFRPGG